MNGAMTRRGTRGGSWAIRVPRNLDGHNADLPDTTSDRGGFRTFRNCKQPPHTKEHADDGHVP